MTPIDPVAFREAWTADDVAALRLFVGLELPMRYIARKLHRPEEVVRLKAHRTAIADMMGGPVPPGRPQHRSH